MTATESNPYEAAARAQKVLAIVSTVHRARNGRSYTAEELSQFSDGQWDLLSAAAGQKPAGRITRRMVIEAARGWSDQPDDPFDGLAGR